MLTLLTALTTATVLAPLLIHKLGRPAFGLLAMVPAGGFVWVASLFARGKLDSGAAPIAYEQGWMPNAHLNIEFLLDPLAGIFSLIILGMGSLVLLYCWGYFSEVPKRLSAFGAEMIAFCTAMFGLVISDNFLLMFIFWEITSVLSFLLVGYYSERASSRRSAGQALMVTTLGGLTMLVGIVILGYGAQTWTFSNLGEISKLPYVGVAVVLILVGALSKSAIAPMHFWLPGAMAAPTPVSAYLHSAAMVKAGIYLVARLAPTAALVSSWHLTVIPLGVFTMLLGGWMALRQKDLKLILAYGTVSQLGFIIAVVGIGSPAALQAGLALTCAHAMFKATLFMLVGAIDHAAGTRDKTKLSGLGRKQPGLAVLALVSAGSMAGIPPLFGFVAKETALTAVWKEEMLIGMPSKMMLAALVAGSILTMAYSLYFLHSAFATKPGGISVAVREMHPVSLWLWLPPTILTGCTVLFGLFPALIDAPINTHISAQFSHPHVSHLALWHGFTLPLLLSAVIIVVGSVLHWQRRLLSKLYFEKPALGSADAAYDRVLETLRTISLRMTASTQRGSLPINEAVILGTLVLVPLISLITGERTAVRMQLWDSPVQGFIGVLVIVAALAATVLDNRISALIMVGMTGYGIATIFALYGAPDLALTQLLVETISVVVFMLVLRKLPPTTDPKQAGGFKRLRAWLSVAVGVTVVVVATFAMNARRSQPISLHIPQLAKDIGHGANAVNVLLVDIRAWDTFGEISVLVVVATGVASLVYRTRDFQRASRRPTLQSEGGRWLATSTNDRARNRSLLVDVVTRLLFPSMMALSCYFFFAGHNGPGGGFAGGLVAALALTLRYLAAGREELEETLPVDPSKLLGTGLALAALPTFLPLFFHAPPLTSTYREFHLPLIGDLAVVSPLLFDAGVYLIVLGLILQILHSLGSQLDRDEEIRKQRARDRVRRMRRKQQAAKEATTYGR
ncbi:Na+/H+ antiporter subunit A [Corynebacterium epidermidicanis]|uniref:CPA3 family monovalent cation:proton (H+) antiporter-3 subunit A n=1 Tax=Corynebacterium epidermidicanis TaxID=1050174 RepID=A0A0G3GTY9_9CORY|nr:Na+/H+ antiporter subunit A [Corynebacterium epidermidicanis]AKK04010.1 CPA3 family monovalent cation:proton (H+) antiporter-3 subunit A [Corynebacterium epidermidicanis]